MILERALFALKPGTAQSFAAAFAEARLLLEAAPGFHRLEMRPGIESPNNFLLLVWWDDIESHMAGFRQSPAITQWRALLGPYLAGTAAMEHYGEAL